MSHNDAHECRFLFYVIRKSWKARYCVLNASLAQFDLKGCVAAVIKFNDCIHFISWCMITKVIKMTTKIIGINSEISFYQCFKQETERFVVMEQFVCCQIQTCTTKRRIDEMPLCCFPNSWGWTVLHTIGFLICGKVQAIQNTEVIFNRCSAAYTLFLVFMLFNIPYKCSDTGECCFISRERERSSIRILLGSLFRVLASCISFVTIASI